MCGILGILNVPLDLDPRPLMAGRGPDGFVAERVGGVTLYHARLAVVGRDLPETRQPLHHAGVTAVYNGFISNYLELNRLLGVGNAAAEALAVVHSYARGRVAGLARLRGQFAAAVVDPGRGVLTLARDPMGICPLYYAHLGPRGLVFSSQAVWILQDGLLRAAAPAWRINERSLSRLRSFAYTLPDETLITGIHEVPAGTALEFSLEDGSLTGHHELAAHDPGRHEPATPTTVRAALQDAVQRNLLGDTQPWLMLSGGLDSCIVLHCAVEAGIRPQAITLAYPDGENADEVVVALDMARHYGCAVRVVDFPREAARPTAELFRRRVDWPFDGGSLLPKVLLANEVRACGGRIVLGGTGADELFGGYRRHVARLALQERGTPTLAEEHAYYREWIAGGGEDDSAFGRFREAATDRRFADPAFAYDLLEMQQQHNPRVDSCFANTGVEYRPVFQDARIVRLAAGLALQEKTDARLRKVLLRKAFAGEIPARFLELPKRPLRFADMGPDRRWRERVLAAWLECRRNHLMR